MKIEIKKVDAIKRELQFEIPKDRVSQKFNEVYQELGKVAKVKGFRQGKVPRNVLEAEHGRLAQQEVIEKLIPEAYQEGITKESISPIDMPEINDVSLKDGVIRFKALLEIKPDVKISHYKGISVQRKSSQVTDDEINKTFDYIKAGQGKDKEITIDDTFARGLGYPSLEDFKKTLTRQMELEKDRQNRFDIENQVVENLLKNAKLQTPSSLVKKQFDRRLQEIQNRLKQQGLSNEEIKKREEESSKELQEAVERDVKVYLILDKIAELEGIKVEKEENLPAKVIEFLLKEAKWLEESKSAK